MNKVKACQFTRYSAGARIWFETYPPHRRRPAQLHEDRVDRFDGLSTGMREMAKYPDAFEQIERATMMQPGEVTQFGAEVERLEN